MTELEIVRKLLPCPFCGELPVSRWHGCTEAGDDGYWGIDCRHWHAQAHEDTEDEAIAAWNTRKPEAAAIITELEAEVEHLRRILQVARPYISDKAGAGIIGAINDALSRAKGQQRNGK